MSQGFTRIARGAAWTALGGAALMAGMAAAARPRAPKATHVPGQPGLMLSGFPLEPLGYRVDEFFIEGQARSYTLSGALGVDGRWPAKVSQRAPFRTRIVVARPSDPQRFNGTVVVEWLNVSAGADGAPDWNMTHRELIRGGYAWVGVSAQKVGVEGGASLSTQGVPLKTADPARYGELSHPGDAYAYDIFSQAGRAIRARGGSGVLGPLLAKRLIAIGESQSAVFLTTYVNAVDPLAKVYDGVLIHSRFGPAARLDGGSIIGATPDPLHAAVRLHPDLRVPVITVITETDLLGGRLPGFLGARQPDTAKLRVWEIAGTAHGDAYLVRAGFIDSGSIPPEQLAAAWEPMDELFGTKLDKPMNCGPQHHYVVEAALAALDRWARTGEAPPHGAPIQVTAGDPPDTVKDANGNALGGVRSPWVDAPTARLSGAFVASSSPIAGLFGSTEPFDRAELERLYPGGKADYLAKVQASLDQAIQAGFILAADRQEILDLAAVSWRGAP